MKTFAGEYLASFRAYVGDPTETTLEAAYGLGRDAVAANLGILDVAIAHHDALLSMLEAQVSPASAAHTVRAGSEFFLESLSAFEMVQRGFRETRDALQLERRHAEIVRQLSHFLADTALTLDTSTTLDELFRLVAEQARELLAVDCCLVTAGQQPQAHPCAASYDEHGDTRWSVFARWTDIARMDAAVRAARSVAPIPASDLGRYIEIPQGAVGPCLVREWLGSRLEALDGSEIGSIHVINKTRGTFTALDEAVLVHLAQMSSAAIERAQLYAARNGDR